MKLRFAPLAVALSLGISLGLVNAAESASAPKAKDAAEGQRKAPGITDIRSPTPPTVAASAASSAAITSAEKGQKVKTKSNIKND